MEMEPEREKKRVRVTLLHYTLFHLGLILLKILKGLFSSANQGIIPCSLHARIQLMST